VQGQWYAGYDRYDGQAFVYTKEIYGRVEINCVVYEFGTTPLEALIKLKEGLIHKGFIADN
jgi:hypothetical protein